MPFCLPPDTEDPYPASSIDLKCKEKVTDSDSENGSGDEGERKVALRISLSLNTTIKTYAVHIVSSGV